ncbi:MAG: MlaD family protein [Cyclobacteriaceae bacterium]
MEKFLQLSTLLVLCSCANKSTLTLDISNADGLTTSAPVYSKGLVIGRVSDLQLSGQKSILVTMELTKELQNVPNDSKISIENDGLLGGKAVNIRLGSSSEYFNVNDTIKIEDSILEDFEPMFIHSDPDMTIDPIRILKSVSKLDSILIELRRLNENLESQKD